MGPQPKRCHNCKSEDHLIADCPTRTERQRSGGSSESQQEQPQNAAEELLSTSPTVSAE